MLHAHNVDDAFVIKLIECSVMLNIDIFQTDLGPQEAWSIIEGWIFIYSFYVQSINLLFLQFLNINV